MENSRACSRRRTTLSVILIKKDTTIFNEDNIILLNDFLEIAPPWLFPKVIENRRSLQSDYLFEDTQALFNALERNTYREPTLIYTGDGEGQLDFGGTFAAARKTLDIISYAYHRGSLLDSYHLLKKLYQSLIHYIFSLALRGNYALERFPETNKQAREAFNNAVTLLLKELEKEELSPSNPTLSKIYLLEPEVEECQERFFKERLEEFHKVLELYTSSNALYNNEEQFRYTNEEAKLEFKKNLSFALSLVLSFITLVKPMLISSGDFIEALNVGGTPKEGSQFWIAPAIQRYFDFYVNEINPNLVKYLKDTNYLDLDITLANPQEKEN